MILTNNSYRLINLDVDTNNNRITSVYYDIFPNSLISLPNHVDSTNTSSININSTQSSTIIPPINNITYTNYWNNYFDNNRSESIDEIFNLINSWVNSISTINNNIHVQYLEESQGIQNNMSLEMFSKMIKNVNYSTDNEQKNCPICTLDFEKNDEIKSTPCNHLFHENCIREWLTQKCTHPLCPVCRHDCREVFIDNTSKKKKEKGNKKCTIS
tara:strand:- start:691 stop:1332 length:642 start_codon:yes stop_codon:yes gene_type:complete